MKKTIGFIITAGHLDIEWYQPLNSYRFWTVAALEDLKNYAAPREDFKTYVLDGQVYPLEIYLESVPEDREEMRRLIKEGKLTVGPFYTQFDEWLPSPESMVRNCLWGDRKAKELGGCMKAGYLPDNFGHPLQLPQILNNFGIDSLMFMRGMPYVNEEFPDEFMYKGLDGSRVFACHFRNSYSGAFDLFDKDIDPMLLREVPYYDGYFSYEWHRGLAHHDDPQRIAQKLVESAKKMIPLYPSNVLPLISGFDHLPPQINIGDSVKIANEIQDEIEFVMGDAEEYVRLAKENMVADNEYSNELIGSHYQFVLLGALSTRTYIKRQHFACEALLEKYAEPLTTLATLYGFRDKPAILNDAWNKMLINCAHDSIHGSSVDEVHTEMEGRYGAVRQSTTGLIHDALAYMGNTLKPWADKAEHEILTFAPTCNGENQLYELWLPIGDRKVSVSDCDGNIMPTYIEKREVAENSSIGIIRNFPAFDERLRKVTFVAGVDDKNALGKFKTCEGVDFGTDIKGDGTYIENEFIKVTAKGALIDLIDKKSGKIYYNLNLLQEDADAGDAWDFSSPWTPGETVLSSQFEFTSCLKSISCVKATLCISGEMSVPKKLCGDLRSRERATIPVTFEISLTSGVARADVKLTFENTAEDHRLRLRVPTYIKTDFVRSGGAFAAIDRPITRPATVPGASMGIYQPPTRILPFREWTAVEDGTSGLAVAFKGVYEYEAENDVYTCDAELMFTLLRGFGVMTRSYMKSRWHPAACATPVPDAQCKGMQTVEWSYIPYTSEKDDKTPFMGRVQSFLYPPVSHKVYRTDKWDATFTNIPAVFEIKKTGIRVSAFMQCYDRDGYILRLYEEQGNRTEIEVPLCGFTNVFLCDMNEKNIEKLNFNNGKVILNFDPYKIITLKLIP